MKPYKIAVNMEWTSKCNARCIMCPQSEIIDPMLMKQDVFDLALERLDNPNIFRIVVAGYGEPTTHPKFSQYVAKIKAHPATFDMVTNGQLLDEEKIRQLDGAINTLIISFSSIDPDVYKKVHVNLEHEVVKANILLAKKLFKKTNLGISLTPLTECIDTLEDTINWFKENGIEALSMSPTLYNRGGNMKQHDMATKRLRCIIKLHNLHSQELDFVPGVLDISKQTLKNKFKCLPRNVDLFVTSNGDYLYCYNDISHQHTMGNINELTINEALRHRENMGPIAELCDNCNMRDRYKTAEISKVLVKYALKKLTTLST